MWKCRDAGMLGWGVENKGCFGFFGGKDGQKKKYQRAFLEGK